MSFVLQVIRTDMAAPESIQSRLVHFHQFFGIISIIRKTGLERERGREEMEEFDEVRPTNLFDTVMY